MERLTFKQYLLAEAPKPNDDGKFHSFMDKVTGADGPKMGQKMSIMDAFGSKEYNLLKKMGIRFMEKPSYWEDLNKPQGDHYKPITEAELDKAEKAIGMPFKIYTADKIFGSGSKPRGPLADADLPPEPVCIVHFKDGTKYLVDTTQANTYIRFWAKIE